MPGTEFYRTLRGIRMGLFKPTFLKGPIANRPYFQCNVMIGPYRCVGDFGHQGECESIRIEFNGVGHEVEVYFKLGDFTVERWPDIRMKFEERNNWGYVVSKCDGLHSFLDDC
jgi:hypothetical protein